MTVLLFSTGMDSFIADRMLKNSQDEKIERVYFDISSGYSDAEINFLYKTYDNSYFRIIEDVYLKNIERDDFYVPNRNLIFATLAQSIFDADRILINGVKDDRVGDQGLSFYQKLSETLTVSAKKNVVVESLLIDREKSEWCKIYSEHYNKLDLIEKTYSCFHHKLIENSVEIYSYDNDEYKLVRSHIPFYGCLNCVACYRKLAALTSCDMYIPFKDSKLVHEYPFRINPQELPNRYDSARKFSLFTKWYERNK